MITDVDLCTKYLRLQDSAQKRGLEFTVTLCGYKNLLKRRRCPYTGVELIKSGEKCNTSIDRIDNNKGYVSGNLIACERLANLQKNNLSEDMILNMAKVIRKRRKYDNSKTTN